MAVSEMTSVYLLTHYNMMTRPCQGTWQNYLGSNLISYAICRTLQNLAEPLHNYQLGHFDR